MQRPWRKPALCERELWTDPVVTWDELERLELVREGAFWQLPDGSVCQRPGRYEGSVKGLALDESIALATNVEKAYGR